jgi:hypothetical protein
MILEVFIFKKLINRISFYLESSNFWLTEKLINKNLHLIRLFNVTNNTIFFCKFFNFTRYILRLISAYIIVTFTIQRTIALCFPFFQHKMESKKNTWIIVLSIVLVSGFMVSWVPFFFNIEHVIDDKEHLQFCDIISNYYSIYFKITFIYIGFITLIPILIICVCNSFSIYYLFKTRKKRQELLNICMSIHIIK